MAESSAFSRGLIRSGLDMAGYRVIEAASLDEAVRGLEQQKVDFVIAAADLPSEGTSALLAAMRRRAEWESIPLLALMDSDVVDQALAIRKPGLQDYQVKFDREAMLESLLKLSTALTAEEPVLICAGGEW